MLNPKAPNFFPFQQCLVIALLAYFFLWYLIIFVIVKVSLGFNKKTSFPVKYLRHTFLLTSQWISCLRWLFWFWQSQEGELKVNNLCTVFVQLQKLGLFLDNADLVRMTSTILQSISIDLSWTKPNSAKKCKFSQNLDFSHKQAYSQPN
jgi:hypothetical protein